MRVRPVFLFILLFSCISVLLFAVSFRSAIPAILQVRLDQTHPSSHHVTRLLVHLSDEEGLPIDRAQVVSHVNMTNMDMGMHVLQAKELGSGEYIEQLQLDMAGPWAIVVTVQAAGFAPLKQVMQVQVA